MFPPLQNPGNPFRKFYVPIALLLSSVNLLSFVVNTCKIYRKCYKQFAFRRTRKQKSSVSLSTVDCTEFLVFIKDHF